ncbi:hypothetical protein VNN41_06410 [Lactococcus garvieae]|uniref:hypothetical protein n=1 Tax=Lactococcus garvieae TaxID=1363 RepID=UPI003255DB86
MTKKAKEAKEAKYTATVWADGDTITADKLNTLETGVVGLGIKSLELTTTSGAVTGGTVTLGDNTTVPITVTEA